MSKKRRNSSYQIKYVSYVKKPRPPTFQSDVFGCKTQGKLQGYDVFQTRKVDSSHFDFATLSSQTKGEQENRIVSRILP